PLRFQQQEDPSQAIVLITLGPVADAHGQIGAELRLLELAEFAHIFRAVVPEHDAIRRRVMLRVGSHVQAKLRDLIEDVDDLERLDLDVSFSSSASGAAAVGSAFAATPPRTDQWGARAPDEQAQR